MEKEEWKKEQAYMLLVKWTERRKCNWREDGLILWRTDEYMQESGEVGY